MSFLNRRPATSDEKLNPLIKQLGHKDTAKREQAKQEIITAIAADTQRLNTLLVWLEHDLCRVQRMLQWYKFVATCALLYMFRDLLRYRWEAALHIMLGGFGIIAAFIMPLTNHPRLKLLLNIVSNLYDKRFIGPLVEAYRYQEVRSVIIKSLSELLPQLQHSDAGLLNEQQQTLLCQSLNNKNTEWIRTVLKALEQIGDSKAVPYVESLAMASTTEPETREAAQECLLYLKQRLEQQQASQSLLRPSASSSRPDMLLRAATIPDAIEPNQLLRADNSIASRDT